MINPSGEMRGFSKPISGKLKLASKKSVSEEFPKEKLLFIINQKTEEYEKIYSEIRDLESKIEVLKNNKNNLEVFKKRIENDILYKKENFENLKQRLEYLNSRKDEYNESDAKKFESLVSKNEAALEKIEKIIKIKSDEILKIEILIDDQGGEKYKEIKNQRKYLIQTEEKLDQDITKESASKQVREIISAKQTGRLKGIIGRLGDLGSIDSEYDIAVSSATNMLDFIVVEKVVNGEDLVSFIREKNLGKINVIILEKIQNLNFSNFSTPDPRALRLFDLIKVFDSRIKNAFYLALQNTLVTKTLEEARNIAFNSTKR